MAVGVHYVPSDTDDWMTARAPNLWKLAPAISKDSLGDLTDLTRQWLK